MLHTLWLFLQILLITVLILLALAVVIILLILFAPVRYNLYGEKHEKSRLQARISWLGFVLCFRARYDACGLSYNLKTFGGTLINSDDIGEAKEEDTKDTEAGAGHKEKAKKKSKEKTKDKSENGKNREEHKEEDTENKEIVSDKDFKTEKQGILTRIGKIIDKFLAAIKSRIDRIIGGIKTLKARKDRLMKFLRSSNTKRAWAVVKDVLIRLLNHIKPTKIKGQVTYGTGDPASTGTNLGYMSIALPFYYNKIDITPDFENKILDGEIYIRGRIRVINVLSYAIKLLVNKYVRKAIRQFKSISGGNSNGK